MSASGVRRLTMLGGRCTPHSAFDEKMFVPGGRHTREPTVVGEKPKTCDATVYSRAVKRFGDGARTCDNPTTVGIKPERDARRVPVASAVNYVRTLTAATSTGPTYARIESQDKTQTKNDGDRSMRTTAVNCNEKKKRTAAMTRRSPPRVIHRAVTERQRRSIIARAIPMERLNSRSKRRNRLRVRHSRLCIEENRSTSLSERPIPIADFSTFAAGCIRWLDSINTPM